MRNAGQPGLSLDPGVLESGVRKPGRREEAVIGRLRRLELAEVARFLMGLR